MAESFRSRLKHAWNTFRNHDPTYDRKDYGISYSVRPDRIRLTRGNERSIVNSVFNRIAMDSSVIEIKHVQLDGKKRYIYDRDSYLNDCLTTEANIDQTARAFRQDMYMSMLDEGCIAVVPVDTDLKLKDSGAFDIETMRVGKITQWYPKHVKVRLYNDETGRSKEIILPKKTVAIVENPFYTVMNEGNSIAQRLIRKLNLLDAIDEQSGSGKLDLIIQLPYMIKSEARKRHAEKRRQEIEKQLSGSKYGIAYADGTEKITQLNRSVENNLMKQIEFLTRMLYSQLGLTEEIMNGTADEETMNNYYTRTIEPIVSAIVDEFKRKFLTKTARTQGQSIVFFRDPFKLVSTSKLAELVDKFTRNEVMSSNEWRQIIGLIPSDDPKADELRNKNISQSKEELANNEQTNPEEADSLADLKVSEL